MGNCHILIRWKTIIIPHCQNSSILTHIQEHSILSWLGTNTMTHDVVYLFLKIKKDSCHQCTKYTGMPSCYENIVFLFKFKLGISHIYFAMVHFAEQWISTEKDVNITAPSFVKWDRLLSEYFTNFKERLSHSRQKIGTWIVKRKN